MTARLGAGNTDLGRRIRAVQDLSERILQLNADDQKLLTDWHKVQTADPTYNAALEEFRAASAANFKNPAVKRQRELAQQFQALIARCPPGQKKAGCDDRERDALAKEMGEVSKEIGAGSGAIMAIHQRMEAAEKALPGYAAFTSRRTALRNDIDRADRRGAGGASPDRTRVSDLRGALRPAASQDRGGAGAAAARRGAGRHPGRRGQELRVGRHARARRMGADRRQRAGPGRARRRLAHGARPPGAAGCRGRIRQPGRRRAALRSCPRACALSPGAWRPWPRCSRTSAT